MNNDKLLEELDTLYKKRNIQNKTMRNTEDLKILHDFDYESVNGYQMLDDIHKKCFKNFIVRFYNSHGLTERVNIVPKGIYWVEAFIYKAKKHKDDESGETSAFFIFSIDKEGNKHIIRQWEHERSKFEGMIEVIEIEKYLRFEYAMNGSQQIEWVRIIENGKEWF